MQQQEIVGMVAGTGCALALVSLLMWIAGESNGVSRAKLKRGLAMVWLSVVMALGGMVAAREYAGVRVPPRLALVVCAAWTLAWTVLALRTAGRVCGAPKVAVRPAPEGLHEATGGTPVLREAEATGETPVLREAEATGETPVHPDDGPKE